MRKLKLQVQMTVDGFVAGPEGQLDWMTRNLDEGAIARIVEITDSSDTILLGRKMTDGFIKYWEAVQPDSPEYVFARRMGGHAESRVQQDPEACRRQGCGRGRRRSGPGGEPAGGGVREGPRRLRWREVCERLD